MKKILIALTVLSISSCTQNQMARNFGGTQDVNLKPNEKLINITWKESSLWILTEDTLTHNMYFRESSPFGVMNGSVNIIKN